MERDDLTLALIILCSMLIGIIILYIVGCKFGNRCLRKCFNQNNQHRATIGIVNPLVLRDHRVVVQITPYKNPIIRKERISSKDEGSQTDPSLITSQDINKSHESKE